MVTAEMLGTYVTVIFYVGVLSFYLYKETPLFRIAENIAIGVALGNATVVALKYLNDVAWTPGIIRGQDTLFWGACLVFGGLTLVRFPRKYAWLARWPLALVVGTGLGVGLRGAVDAQLVKQVIATITPVVGGSITPIDNLVMAVITLTIVAYFIFTREHKGPLGPVSKVARYAMMMTLGGAAGNIIFTRLAWLVMILTAILKALGLG